MSRRGRGESSPLHSDTDALAEINQFGRLVKYHEALKVQEARDAGREEGRLEVSQIHFRDVVFVVSELIIRLSGLPRNRKMDDRSSYSHRASRQYPTNDVESRRPKSERSSKWP